MEIKIDVIGHGELSVQPRKKNEAVFALGHDDVEKRDTRLAMVIPLKEITPDMLRRAADLLDEHSDSDEPWGLPCNKKHACFVVHPTRQQFGLAVFDAT